MTLTLTVLGCVGSSFDADLQQPCSSYLLETPEVAVLLDCGFGSFASCRENAPDTRLDAIFVSHAHRDHCSDIEAFVTCPSLWRERARLLASRATINALSFDLESTDTDVIIVADGASVNVALFRVECSATTHQMPTLAVQISVGGARVVYSADTGPEWNAPPAFCRPDLALVECTLVSRDASSSPFHLDAEEVAHLAQSLDAPRTMITHVPPHESGQDRLDIATRAAPERKFILAASGRCLLVDTSTEEDDYR